MTISDEKMEESLHFLAESDATFAHLKQRVEALERYVDLVKSQEFLEATGPVEERKAQARVAQNTRDAQRKYLEALEEYEKLSNERQTSQTKIWIWKTYKQSSNNTGV